MRYKYYRNKKRRKKWGLLASILFIIGFLGIHTIIIKNLILEPSGLMDTVHIGFLELSPGEMILNAFNFIWGATIWHSVKKVLF